jgi:hypothetical protein
VHRATVVIRSTVDCVNISVGDLLFQHFKKLFFIPGRKCEGLPAI